MVPQDLNAVAFPTLDTTQLGYLGACSRTKLVRHADGDRLVEAGDIDFKFYVVKSGRVDVVDDSGDEMTTIAVHGPGQFTGEVAMMTGGPSLVTLIVRGDTEVFEVTSEVLREIVNRYPDLGDQILQAFLARRQLLTESEDFTGVRVIGSQYSRDTSRVRDFLFRVRMPFRWLDIESDPKVKKLLELFGAREEDTPVVAWGKKILLKNPSNEELAAALGVHRPLKKEVYDLVVVGAGPAGLGAAVYAASEGLSTVVVDSIGPGGQAGRSMRIENYLGFPTGITGADLTERALVQAGKFGANVSAPASVSRMSFENGYPLLQLDDGETVAPKCVLIATGAEYRRLAAEGCEQFEGRGVYYAATMNEVSMCRGSEVVVVGGGNSAGQAAVFLSEHASKVHLIVRASDLHKDMSAYLARRIENTPSLEILLGTRVNRISGNSHVGSVELENVRTGEKWHLQTPVLFSFIGAIPRTKWLPAEVERDEKGFVITGAQIAKSPHWKPKRPPFLLETSHAGVFAAGDVRSGSVKRVASAVGEGAMAVTFVHEYMASSR
jgi:thioredoxin reductase (NADPH)